MLPVKHAVASQIERRSCRTAPPTACRVNLAAAPPKPVVDRSFQVPSQESIENLTAADVPPPLQPFAGRQQAAMPPSPAKPFSVPASPLKPSPYKDRVDAATRAVANKMTQAKRGALFAAPKTPVAAGGSDENAQ